MGGKSEYSRSDLLHVPPEELLIAGLDFDAGAEHVLNDIDSNAEDVPEEFILNIMANGVLEPVGIRRAKHTDGNVLEVAYGRKRTRGAREANKRLIAQGLPPIKVPCVVKNADEKSLIAAIISENEQRRVTSPMECARNLQKCYARGMTIDEAAIHFGKTVTTLRNWEKLLGLNPAVQARVDTGDVPMTLALDLSSLPTEEQPAALDKALAAATKPGGRVSGAKARRALRQSRGQQASKPVAHKLTVRLASIATERQTLEPQALEFVRWLAYGDTPKDPALVELIAEIEKPATRGRKTKGGKRKASSSTRGGAARKTRGRPRKTNEPNPAAANPNTDDGLMDVASMSDPVSSSPVPG